MKMKTLIYNNLTWSLMLLLTITFVACDDDDDEMDDQQDIVELAQDNANLSTLVTAIQTANLTTTLKGDGPFTVFAPTNAAFNNLPDGVLDDLLANPAELEEVLRYHVVSGSVPSSNLSNGPVGTLLSGESIDVDISSGVTLNGSASVTTPDIMAENGIVHIIDEVLLPSEYEQESILEIAGNDSQFSTLVDALSDYPDIISALQGDGPFTVFAPNNQAFQNFLDSDDRFSSLDDLDAATLEEVLKYHVISGQELFAMNISSGNVTTFQGEDVEITKDGNAVSLNNNTNVTTADIDASNGVIHVIDNIILPPSLQQQSIATIATNNSDLSTLTSILTSPGFEDLLNAASDDNSTLTVFAPTNAAFDQLLSDLGKNDLSELPDEVVRDIIEYHMLGSEAFSDDLMEQDYPTLLDGESVSVTLGSEVMIDDATVTTADVNASNGAVHVIDKVLLPSLYKSALGTVVEVPLFNNNYTTLVAALKKADLVTTLIEGGDFTVFAPNNEAFEAAGITSLDGLSAEALEPILLYHVVSGKVMAADLPSIPDGVVTTLNAEGYSEFFLSLGEEVYINGNTEVTATDIVKDNGVIHTIDKTLTPPSQTVVEIVTAMATADMDAEFTTLYSLLTDPAQSGVLDAISDEAGNFTIFAPTDAAFDEISSVTATLSDDEISQVLTYHVIADRVFSTDLSDGMMPSTVNGKPLTINVGGNVTITDQDGTTDDATVIDVNIHGVNGVIHVIDKVLVPTLE